MSSLILECLRAEGKNSLYITGSAGVGKSTLFNSIVSKLKVLGCRVMGFAAPEVRSGGRRVGFKLVDLQTGEEAWLARRGVEGSPRIGSYAVLVREAEVLGVRALESALREADVIGIDEIGPMELLVPGIRRLVEEAIRSYKPKLSVIHRRLRSLEPELYSAIERGGCIIELTLDNRGYYSSIAGRLAEAIAFEAGCDEGRGGHIIRA